jgi:PAS domain S-box-containing protein
LIGRSFREVVTEEAYAESEPRHRLAQEGQRQQWLAHRAHGHHGDKWYQITVVPYWPNDGEVHGVFVLLDDVTELQRSEAEIRKLSAEQQSLLENTVAGIAFVQDERIVRCNRSLAELFGYELAEMAGLPLEKLHPSFSSRSQSVTRHIAERGVEMSDVQLKRKDGALFWCQQSITALDRRDLAKGVVWVVEDISDRRRAELELRQCGT